MPADIFVTMIGAFAGALVAGFAGFGFSAAAGVVLVRHLDPLEAIPLMMVCSVLVQSHGMVRLRHTMQPRRAATFCLGGLFGVAVALPVLAQLNADTFRALFGAFLVIYGLSAFRRVSRPPSPTAPGVAQRMAVGAASGAIGTLTALPSAVLVIWADRRGEGKEALRGTIQPFILAMQLTALAGFAISGLLDYSRLLDLLLPALPALVLGSLLGLWTYRRIGGTAFRRAILLILISSGSLMVVG